MAQHDEKLIFGAKGGVVGQREVMLADLAPPTFVMVPDDCGLANTTWTGARILGNQGQPDGVRIYYQVLW